MIGEPDFFAPTKPMFSAVSAGSIGFFAELRAKRVMKNLIDGFKEIFTIYAQEKPKPIIMNYSIALIYSSGSTN